MGAPWGTSVHPWCTCDAPGWWGHLVTPSVSQNFNGENREGADNKNNENKLSWGMKTPYRILSQENNAVVCATPQNNGIFEPSLGQGRGRPRQTVPENLIMELNSQGFSSRAMAARLNEQGIAVSYKTIQRRLQASSL